MEIKRKHAIFTAKDGVGTLQITEATRLNLLDSAVILDLIAVLDEAKHVDSINSLVLRGTGDSAFVAGAHINEMVNLNRDSARIFITHLKNLCQAVQYFPVPVIARIPGWCLGGGLELAMACDMRIIATEAKVGMPEVKVGIPSVLYAAMLPRLIGNTHTNWMLLSGEMVDASTAEQWGLVNFAVPLSELDEKINELTAQLAALGPQVIRQQKRLLNHWHTAPLDQAIEESVEDFSAAFDTGEPEYYMNYFLNKDKK